MFSLSIECHTQQGAESFSEYFDGVSFELNDGLQSQCFTEVLQDNEENWWCRTSLRDLDMTWSNRQEGALKVLQSVQLENAFYESLKAAPPFRYALVGEGVDECITNSDLPGTYRKIIEESLPAIAYIQGIVMSEAMYQLLSSPSKQFQSFSPGYVWLPPRGKLISVGGCEPEISSEMLRSNFQQAEEFYQSGSTFLGQARYEEALTAYESALRLAPRTAATYQGKAVALYYLSRSLEALQACETALQINPNFVEAHHLKAGILLAQGQLQEALAACDQVQRLNPQFPQNHVVRQQILQNSGQVDPAAESYERGLNLLSSNQYQAAIAAFDRVLQFYPNQIDAYVNKGLALGQLGRHAEALIAFEAALRLNPMLDRVHVNRDSALYNLGRAEEILGTYHDLLRSKPNYAYGHYRRGIVLDQLGRSQEALRSLNEAIRLNPTDAAAYHSQGIVLDRLGQSREALQALNTSLRLDPNSLPAQASKRIVLEKLGQGR